MRRSAILALSLIVFAACGSSETTNDEGSLTDVVIGYDNGGQDIPAPLDTNTPDTTVSDEGDVAGGDVPGVDANSLTREILLQVDNSNPIDLAINQQFTFRAQIVEIGTSTPVPNPAVSFTITYVEDMADGEEVLEYDSSIMRPSSVGDAEGRVSSTFQAGETPNYLYTITVSSNGAESRTFQILVQEMDCACSNITLTYEGVPGDGASYRLMAFDSSHTCASLAAADELPPAVAEINHGDITTPANIPCLTPGETYTVMVVASETCTFAEGCAEGVTVGAANDAENCGTGTVALEGAEVNINKMYEGKQKFTFTNVVPTCSFSSSMNCSNLAGMSIGDQICCYLNAVQELFKDDGTRLANAIADEASLGSGDRAEVVSQVKSWVASNTPSWVASAKGMGAALRNVIVQTNMTSLITINAPDGDGNFTGTEDWRRFVLYWKLDCDPQDPEYYLCGKFELAMQAVGGVSYSPTISKSNFTGSLGIANNFSIDEHEIGLNPGRMIVYVTNKVAAATLTGGYINASQELITLNAAKDLKEAYGRWMDCEAIAGAVSGSVSAVTQAVCEAAIDGAMADVTAAHDALVVDSHMMLGGTGAYTDATCDGYADELSSGVYTGNYVRGAEEIEMTGTFSGIDED